MRDRPKCKVDGIINRMLACGHVIVGDKTCGYEGFCQHQEIANGLPSTVQSEATASHCGQDATEGDV